MSIIFANCTPPSGNRAASPGSIDSEEKYLNEWAETSDKYHESFEEEEEEEEEEECEDGEHNADKSRATDQLPADILVDDDLICDPHIQLPNDTNEDDKEDEVDDKEDEEAALEGMDLETYMSSAINSKSDGDEHGTPEMMETMMQGLDGVSPPSSRKRSVRISTPLTHRNDDQDSPSQHVLQSILHEISDMKTQLHDMHVSPKKVDPVQQYSHLLHRKPTKSIKTLLGHKPKPKETAIDTNYNLSASGVARLEPTDEMKLNKLISEVQRYTSIIERQNSKIAELEEQVSEMSAALHQRDETIQRQIGKVNRALRAKKQLSERVSELQEEMSDYEKVITAVEALRNNETQLLQKVQYLMSQNEDLSIQLKNSLTREIEWRTMHKSELSNQLHATAVPTFVKHEKTASAPSLASRTTDKPQPASKKKKQKRHSISENILPRISKRA